MEDGPEPLASCVTANAGLNQFAAGAEAWVLPAERHARQRQERTIDARFADDHRSVDVSDPPPPDLQRNGKTYFAHFNARRAHYCVERLPT